MHLSSPLHCLASHVMVLIRIAVFGVFSSKLRTHFIVVGCSGGCLVHSLVCILPCVASVSLISEGVGRLVNIVIERNSWLYLLICEERSFLVTFYVSVRFALLFHPFNINASLLRSSITVSYLTLSIGIILHSLNGLRWLVHISITTFALIVSNRSRMRVMLSFLNIWLRFNSSCSGLIATCVMLGVLAWFVGSYFNPSSLSISFKCWGVSLVVVNNIIGLNISVRRCIVRSLISSGYVSVRKDIVWRSIKFWGVSYFILL